MKLSVVVPRQVMCVSSPLEPSTDKVTLTVPSDVCERGGETQVTSVEETKSAGTRADPKKHERRGEAEKPVPLRATDVPPEAEPKGGDSEDGISVDAYAKVVAGRRVQSLPPLREMASGTATGAGAAAGGETHMREWSEGTRIAGTARVPKRHKMTSSVPPSYTENPKPLIVTRVNPHEGPPRGETLVTRGGA